MVPGSLLLREVASKAGQFIVISYRYVHIFLCAYMYICLHIKHICAYVYILSCPVVKLPFHSHVLLSRDGIYIHLYTAAFTFKPLLTFRALNCTMLFRYRFQSLPNIYASFLLLFPLNVLEQITHFTGSRFWA